MRTKISEPTRCDPSPFASATLPMLSDSSRRSVGLKIGKSATSILLPIRKSAIPLISRFVTDVYDYVLPLSTQFPGPTFKQADRRHHRCADASGIHFE